MFMYIMNKDEYVKIKIQEHYKQKDKQMKINDKYKKLFKEKQNKNEKKNAAQNKTNNNYNQKSQTKKIIYEYRKLAEVQPIYRVLNSLSSRINDKMKKLGLKREFTYIQILGCKVNEFEEYLLNKMTEGMTYENYGEWEVDHIIPFSSFDFNNLEQIKACCHYTNLQPLWKTDNRKKSNKLI